MQKFCSVVSTKSHTETTVPVSSWKQCFMLSMKRVCVTELCGLKPEGTEPEQMASLQTSATIPAWETSLLKVNHAGFLLLVFTTSSYRVFVKVCCCTAVQEIPCFCTNRILIIELSTTHHWTPFLATCIRSKISPPTSITVILLLTSHLCRDLLRTVLRLHVYLQ